MVLIEKNVTDFFVVMLFLCFVLFQPNSRKVKWSPELTSDKVYAVETPRPSYPGKTQPSNNAVNEKRGGISEFEIHPK